MISSGAFFDTHGESFLVKMNEFRCVSCVEIDAYAVELVVKHPTELVLKCIASNEPKLKHGRWQHNRRSIDVLSGNTCLINLYDANDDVEGLLVNKVGRRIFFAV